MSVESPQVAQPGLGAPLWMESGPVSEKRPEMSKPYSKLLFVSDLFMYTVLVLLLVLVLVLVCVCVCVYVCVCACVCVCV